MPTDPDPPSGAGDLVIAANRLPVEILPNGEVARSPGGLVSALSAVSTDTTQWVGWLGPGATEQTYNEFKSDNCHPVPLSKAEVRAHYEGFCNSIVWPLFHGRLRSPELTRSWWRSYRAVNQRFASTVAAVAPEGGTVWVHDYHLLLTAAMLRARRPDLRIGFFLHIPFPPAQLFAMLPWRREILLGMVGADLIGFQTPDDVRNVLDSLEHYGGGQWRRRHGRMDIDAFPISIDFAHWSSLGLAAATSGRERRAALGADFVLVGVDRLDYTKGIVERLWAFGELLDEGLLDPATCSFVQIAVPGRSNIDSYREERQDVEALVNRINERHRRPNGEGPIRYLPAQHSEEELAGWYRGADALVVTSLADGMNLVAKEFVACRGDAAASIVLSEFAGAAQDLPGAIIVNPYDTDAVKRAMLDAYRMSMVERVARMTSMREQVRSHDVHLWARSFLDRLTRVCSAHHSNHESRAVDGIAAPPTPVAQK